ncbi:MAG: hypothetical protein RBT43_03975, partial [bacterium]|nr:hypothetical protein [bacterium]
MKLIKNRRKANAFLTLERNKNYFFICSESYCVFIFASSLIIIYNIPLIYVNCIILDLLLSIITKNERTEK